MNLRELARGQECQVRLPGVCNFNPETTVLAHFRMIDVSGMGIKSPDLIAAWCCSACHDVCDRRARTDLDRNYVALQFLRGVIRTQARLIERDLIHVGKAKTE